MATNRPLTADEANKMFHAIDEAETNRRWRESHPPETRETHGMSTRPIGLRRALRIALATIELHTGDGCQDSDRLLLDAAGDVDYEETARLIRNVLAQRTRED